jgi:hypothetical protein
MKAACANSFKYLNDWWGTGLLIGKDVQQQL